jgi:hypothetical protein
VLIDRQLDAAGWVVQDRKNLAGPKLAKWLRSLDGQAVDKDAATDLARLAEFRDR